MLTLQTGGGGARGGLVTKSRRSFSDFTNHEDNFIFTIFLNTPDNKNNCMLAQVLLNVILYIFF